MRGIRVTEDRIYKLQIIINTIGLSMLLCSFIDKIPGSFILVEFIITGIGLIVVVLLHILNKTKLYIREYSGARVEVYDIDAFGRKYNLHNFAGNAMVFEGCVQYDLGENEREFIELGRVRSFGLIYFVENVLHLREAGRLIR